jgi:hypothetical protein
MIDPTCENLVKLNHARIPGNPHTATRWRWALHGVKGIRLESIRCGAVRYTSAEAVARFLAALNAPGDVPEPRNAAAEAAGRRLAEMGC